MDKLPKYLVYNNEYGVIYSWILIPILNNTKVIWFPGNQNSALSYNRWQFDTTTYEKTLSLLKDNYLSSDRHTVHY